MTQRITAIRTQVLREVPPPEGIDVTALRTQVLRSATGATSKKGSVVANVVYSPAPVDPATGENSVHGFVAVATAIQGWTAYEAYGDTYNGSTRDGSGVLSGFLGSTPFPVGYSANADPVLLHEQFARLFPDGGVMAQVDTGSGATGRRYTYTYHPPGNTFNNGTVIGTTPRGLDFTNIVESLTISNAVDFTTGANAPDPINFDPVFATWVDPPPDGFPMTLRGWRLERKLIEVRRRLDTLAIVQQQTTRRNQWGFIRAGETDITPVVLPPCLPVVIRPGRGLYRVVRWNPGYANYDAFPRLYPFPGKTSARLKEFEGRVYNGIEEFIRELQRIPYFVKGTEVDVRGFNLDYASDLVARGDGPLYYSGWATFLDGGLGGGWDAVAQLDVFDDGRYLLDHTEGGITSFVDIPNRYRRLKTIRIWPSISKGRATLQGTFFKARVYPPNGVRLDSFRWQPEAASDFPMGIATEVTMPEFWLEKLDSPSTNFDSTDPLVD